LKASSALVHLHYLRRRLLSRHHRLLAAKIEATPQVEQLVQKVTGLYEQFIKLSQSLNYDTMIAAARVDDLRAFRTPSRRIFSSLWTKSRLAGNSDLLSA